MSQIPADRQAGKCGTSFREGGASRARCGEQNVGTGSIVNIACGARSCRSPNAKRDH
jgi:hypothetical protein